VPIIFLTALSDDESFAKCVASGGDDFLAKPVNKVLLTAKITAMQRIRLMNQELEHYKSRTEEEIELTHQVLKALTKRMNSQHIHELNYWQISAGHFSGDLIIYDKSPSGKLYLLLADFTGHGFSAAIGSLPTADIFFFAMTARDFNVADIVTEINRKLSEIMPVSHFCAAALICFDSISRQIDVFNGGLPPILLFDAEGNIAAQIKSTNLALGILSAESFTAEINIIENIVDSRLIIYSDGLTEAQNAAGEMFGEERLCKILSSNRLPADLTKSSLIDFINHCPLNDDVSFVTLNF
jgi:serine phosphatase RsbU (regulator of sigma subunit)